MSNNNLSKASMRLLFFLLATTPAALAAEEDPCAGGTCPFPSPQSDDGCGMWLGPSPIKQHESHGFGLGVFTGRAYKKGDIIDDSGEVLIPLFDSNIKRKHHPPLREYCWDGDNMPEHTVECDGNIMPLLFIPGIAAIAACTDSNYNAQLSGTGGRPGVARYNNAQDSGGVHRSSSPIAGAFTYRNNVTYVAVRDISAGEELSVQCSDDDFDGGSYSLAQFSSQDDAVTCVDRNVRVAPSPEIGGQGLFAKRPLREGDLVISTPMIPLHKKELQVIDADPSPELQLAMNYCYGHPRSELLLLPYGPYVNYLNHPPPGNMSNVKIRWHVVSNHSNDDLPRRQQFHHPELLELSADRVAKIHGKGLMADIVAIREIMPNEELYIDYGKEWQDAYKKHAENYKYGDKNYQSAAMYYKEGDLLRTVKEQEIHPYPENLQTVCFFEAAKPDWETENDDGEMVVYTTWDPAVNDKNECMRTCKILDRYERNDKVYYKARMSKTGIGACQLENPYVVMDVPAKAVRVADKPYTADMFMPGAFRQPIGVPDGFFPSTWLKSNMRKRTPEKVDHGEIYRKKALV